ncbi:Glutathione S-transferase Mu 1, partial [Fragariocoptes setiger]
MLAHAGADFEEKRYTTGPAPTYDRSQWLNEKFSLGLEFPNLPYMIDGDVKLTQSLTISRYLARKHGLMGKTEAEQQRVDLAEQQIQDYRMAFAMMCYRPEFEELKKPYLEDLPNKLKLLTSFIGKRQFIAGDYVTYVDFMLYEWLDQQTLLVQTALDEFPELKAYHNRVKSLPKVAEYLASNKNISYPINGDMAVFGGRDSKK